MDPLLDEEHEGHENHERYLITYADMITLLLALFIILFALGQVDLAKFDRFRAGLTKQFGAPGLEGGTGVLEGGRDVLEGFSPAAQVSGAGGLGTKITASEERRAVAALEKLVRKAGAEAGQADVKIDRRGIVVVLSTDDVTFPSGSWALQPAGVDVLHALFGPLSEVTNEIVVEGHTDDRPMTPPLTNWELAANRSAAVVRYLESRGVASRRLSVAAYADTRPLAPNFTDAGRAMNRRVEIVVVVPGGGSVVAEELPVAESRPVSHESEVASAEPGH